MKVAAANGIASLRRDVAGGRSLPEAVAAAGALSAGAALDELSQAGRMLHGAGPVQVLLEEEGVTDVVIHRGGVWADRGEGMQQADLAVGGEREVRALAVRLAALAGVRLDDAAPIADGVLPSGVRLHAVIPPVAADGTSISLRTHRQRDFTLTELERRGAVGPAGRALLADLMVGRANGVISGATGTGKTTLLAALLREVDSRERIVCVEEVTELRPEHPHVVHLQARAANVQASGEVSLAELVRASLRMRPDRIVLGEARGAEIREVLTAMNTGHSGSWVTLHANSARDVPVRLAALGALAGWDAATVARQAGAALDVVVHLARWGGTRVVAEIAEAVRDDAGGLRLRTVLRRRGDTETRVNEWSG